jgi:hypothetical protein
MARDDCVSEEARFYSSSPGARTFGSVDANLRAVELCGLGT